ncbi:MAG: TlpA family protein disulfide reductase [bacterium]
MKKTINDLVIMGLLVVCFVCFCAGNGYGEIEVGDHFPAMRFDLTLQKMSSHYFGIKKAKEIDISEINAQVLIVEVLSVYCVSCMSQTAYDRELFSMILTNEKTAGKVKMIGVAAGNNLREVNNFIEEFSVPYPVFPDYKFFHYDMVGQVRTPFKLFLLKKRDKGFEVVKTEAGLNENVKETFRTIVAILEGEYQKEKEEEPVLSQPESIDSALVVAYLQEWLSQRGETDTVKELFEDSGRVVYKIGSDEDIYAIVVNRLSTCDVCAAVQFIYMIDRSGNVIDLIPIHLSKLYNERFNEDDIAEIKERIVSRNVRETIPFNSEVDAVSSATITSGLIYDSINKGKRIFDLLLEKGFIK